MRELIREAFGVNARQRATAVILARQVYRIRLNAHSGRRFRSLQAMAEGN